MSRVAKAVLRKKNNYPWYEWTEEFEWDDDEFEREPSIIEKRAIAEFDENWRKNLCVPRCNECGVSR